MDRPVSAQLQSAAAPDTRALRQVLGTFVTGVTVITTVDAEGRAVGLTANSFTSVSLNPPLILWNQSLTAPSHPVFRDARYFAVNILAEDQVAISRRFAGGGPDKFAGVTVRPGLGGVPLIEGCSAYLECSHEGSFPGGDHAVFLGRVERFERGTGRPLVFAHGRYLTAQPHEFDAAQADVTEDSRAQIHAVRLGASALTQLAQELEGSVALAIAVWGSYGPTVVRWEPPRATMRADLRVGVVSRLLTSATGRAFAAFMPRELVVDAIEAEWVATHSEPAEGVPQTRAELDALWRDTRDAGMARVLGSPHFMAAYGSRINAVCAPVFDRAGRMVLGITAAGPMDRLDASPDARVPQAVRAAAAAVSAQLGHTTRSKDIPE